MVAMRILTWISRVTGSLSMFGSSSIVYMVFSDREAKLTRPYHRLMLMMSIFDILSSFAFVISTAAIPRDEDYYGSIGTKGTCIAQGFLLMLGLAVPLYNSSLNIYYVLTIRYNVSFLTFSRKIEPILHTISILFPLTMAIISTVEDKIKPIPAGRCRPYGKLATIAFVLTLMSSFLISIISMIMISCTTTSQAARMNNYSTFQGRRNSIPQRSRLENDKKDTIKQALLYILAYNMTYTPAIVITIVESIRGEPPDVLLILVNIFYPLQGFWNFLFYIRSLVQYVRTSSDISYLGAIIEVVLRSKDIRIRRESTSRLSRLPTRRSVTSQSPLTISVTPPVIEPDMDNEKNDDP